MKDQHAVHLKSLTKNDKCGVHQETMLNTRQVRRALQKMMNIQFMLFALANDVEQ
jgi:hypothetical protein